MNTSFVENLFNQGMTDQTEKTADNNSVTKDFKELTVSQWGALREVGTLKVQPITFQSGTDEQNEPQIVIEFSGADEEILRDKEGQMIDAVQLFVKRVVQHHFPEDRTNIVIDCNGFREESSQALVELAEKLKGIALEKGK
jgi:predicted RNA-binding protein Jag